MEIKSKLLLASVFGLTILTGCNAAQKKSNADISETSVAVDAEESKSMDNKAKLIKVEKVDKSLLALKWQQGTVRFLNLEGGFYGIITEDGTKLLPMNLKSEYRLNGAIVKVKGQLQKDVITIQQWGTPFKITEIEVINSENSVPADQ